MIFANIKCRRIEVLADDEVAMTFATDRFQQGQREGVYPSYRPGPTGGESAVVVEDMGKLIGIATHYPIDDGRVWIDLMWIDPARRSEGLGKTLLLAVREAVRKEHDVLIHFGTGLTNEAMAGAARAVGFEAESIGFTATVIGQPKQGFENLVRAEPWGERKAS